MNIEILTEDAGELSGLNGSAVHVAQAIVDQLKREVNRVNARGITILPATHADNPSPPKAGPRMWCCCGLLIRLELT